MTWSPNYKKGVICELAVCWKTFTRFLQRKKMPPFRIKARGSLIGGLIRVKVCVA